MLKESALAESFHIERHQVYVLSKENENVLEEYRGAIDKRAHGDASQMGKFEAQGVSVEFAPLDGTDREHPSKATVYLPNGESLPVTFPVVLFSPRNLINVMLVPREMLEKYWHDKEEFLVIATSPQLEDPTDCLYTYFLIPPSTNGYEAHMMWGEDAQKVLGDQKVQKLLYIFSGESERATHQPEQSFPIAIPEATNDYYSR